MAVVSTSGSGTLSGVVSLTSSHSGYCAVLTSGGVDCWGWGGNGQLGNGQSSQSSVPVSVVSTSGTEALSGVASLTGYYYSYYAYDSSYCAVLTSGGVDCWGWGGFGQLGNGQGSDSNVPVAAVSTSGFGILTGVVS